MFGYDGEIGEDLSIMIAKRVGAQARWPFLTTLDLSMIRNPVQLASTIKDRTGVTRVAADTDVGSWLRGPKQTKPSKVTFIQRWIDDGGSTRSGHRT
jgi:hypothetical protein